MGSSRVISPIRRRPSLKIAELDLQWVKQGEFKHVSGAQLWERARRRHRTCNVSSLLIGLESCAPQTQSPFGHKHDMSGTPSKISVFGCRKWRGYRCDSNKEELPANINGLHVTVTRQKFKNLIDVC